MKPNNVRGIPAVGAPTVWQNLGIHGEGVKVAIIDTGIDYTHANFGGPGTAPPTTAAHAAETQPADPALFGPDARASRAASTSSATATTPTRTRDAYQPIPHPDPNPLDCNGHGSHVAGTAAGSGVTGDGATYTGPYNADARQSGAHWTIGPGVAPKADLYAVRVFGCEGSTDVDRRRDRMGGRQRHGRDQHVARLDRSARRTIRRPSPRPMPRRQASSWWPPPATTDRARTSTGSPAQRGRRHRGRGNRSDGRACLARPSSPTRVNVPAINANGYPLSGPQNVHAQGAEGQSRDQRGRIARLQRRRVRRGCSANTSRSCNRGVCARVAKAIFGQQAGAAAVVMVE